MRTILKIVGVLLAFVAVLASYLAITFFNDQKIQVEDQKLMVKSDEELIGEHLYIDRGGEEPIDVNFYARTTSEKLPLVINIHGGAFIAGDADTLDTQSDRISKNWNVNVATVNYKLNWDRYDKPYAVTEIADTVGYFVARSDQYHVDPERIFLLGYSAGGYYAMAATAELAKDNILVAGQVLCYAFLGGMVDTYNSLDASVKKRIPPALFVLAGDEPIGKGSLGYEEVLRASGIHTDVKVYGGVLHGFIEENNPEYAQLHEKNRSSKSPEAEIVARDAEAYIKAWIYAKR
ncbi:MAG: alpha/beta hydrolase [Propionibacteriaceae bacterium]|nr:alpha/beta hydrolase [Micropruina sp.]